MCGGVRLVDRLALLLTLSLGLACSSGRSRTPSEPGRAGPDAGVTVDGGGVVATPCQTRDDCAQGVCDRIRGRCAQCRVTADCADDQVCNAGRCLESTVCEGDLECTAAGRVCDVAAGRCVACNSAAECNDQPCIGGSCVATRPCESSLDCTDLNMVCGPAPAPAWPESFGGMGCVECVRNQDCEAGSACEGGFCEDVCGGTGRICGEVRGVSCGECEAGALCMPEGRACVRVLASDFSGADLAVASGGAVYVSRDGRDTGAARVWAIDLATETTRTAYVDLDGDYIDGLAVAQGNVFAALTSGELVRGPADGLLTTWREVPRQAAGGGPSSESVWCQALVGHADSLICNLVDYDEVVTTGLYRVPLDGSPATLFEDGLFQAAGLFVSGDEAVWAPVNGSVIAKTNVRTSARQDLVSVQARVIGVADGYVYYRETFGDSGRVPLAGGAAEPLPGIDVLDASEAGVFGVVRGGDNLRIVELGPDGRVAAELFDADSLVGVEQLAVLAVLRFDDAWYVVGTDAVLRVTR